MRYSTRWAGLAALAAAGGEGPINQLRTATVTLDFNRLIVNLQAGQRDAAVDQVTEAVQALAAAGADFVVVTSGTTSTLTVGARKKVSIPFLDLGEATWREVPQATGPVGILATSYAAAGGIFDRRSSSRSASFLTFSGRPAASSLVRSSSISRV